LVPTVFNDLDGWRKLDRSSQSNPRVQRAG
jgi:hypothetical protein